MELDFAGEVFFWKGPAPWHYVAVPEEGSAEIEALSHGLTYGWGVIPVTVRIGGSTWETSLFPKDGLYLVPLKARIRAAERIELGQVVSGTLSLGR